MTDYAGIAAVIAAVGVACPAIAGAIASIVSLRRIAVVHDLVNGQSQKLETLTFKAGKVAGADEERAAPTTGNLPVT